MIRLLLARLRGIIWPAVIAAVSAAASVLAAIFAPNTISLPLAFGLAAVTMALLASRA